MKNLKDLLNISNIAPENVNKTFQKIAETLMKSYVIKKGKKSYAIVEIEFYLYTPSHQDFITYPRDTKAGRWFFHQSGVDLTFKSKDIEYHKEKYKKETYKLKNFPIFGGILIRGIYDIQNDEYIFGPQRCVSVLWDNFDAFEPLGEQYPIIEKETLSTTYHLYQCPRHINIQGEVNRETKIKEWIKRLDLDNNSEIDITEYKNKFFDAPYRFFNLLNNEEPWNYSKIPAKIRPKKEETKEVK